MVVVLVSLDSKPFAKRDIATCQTQEELRTSLESSLSVPSLQNEMEYFDPDIDEFILLEDISVVFNTTKPTKIKVCSKKSNPACPMHKNEKLNLFCPTHRVIVCSHCFLVGEHAECKAKSLQDARPICLEMFENLKLQQLEQSLTSNLKLIEESEQTGTSLKPIFQEKINIAFADLLAALEKRKNEISEEVAKKIDQNLEELKIARENRQKTLKNIGNCISICKNPESSDFEVASALSNFFAFEVKEFNQEIRKLTSFSLSALDTSSLNATYTLEPVKLNPIQVIDLNKPKSLSGFPYHSLGMGGFIFNISAKKKLTVRSLKVMARGEGSWPVSVLFKKGLVLELGGKSSWTTLVPESYFSFPDKDLAEIFNGAIPINQGEIVSFVVVNKTGLTGPHELVQKVCSAPGSIESLRSPSVENEDIAISKSFLLNRIMGTFSVSSCLGDFIGQIDYLVGAY